MGEQLNLPKSHARDLLNRSLLEGQIIYALNDEPVREALAAISEHHAKLQHPEHGTAWLYWRGGNWQSFTTAGDGTPFERDGVRWAVCLLSPECSIDALTCRELARELLDCGFDAVTYWARMQSVRMPQGVPQDSDICLSTVILDGGTVVLRSIVVDDEQNGLSIRLDDVVKAIELMQRHHPKQWGEALAGEHDATHGDLFVQLALFGERRYA